MLDRVRCSADTPPRRSGQSWLMASAGNFGHRCTRIQTSTAWTGQIAPKIPCQLPPKVTESTAQTRRHPKVQGAGHSWRNGNRPADKSWPGGQLPSSSAAAMCRWPSAAVACGQPLPTPPSCSQSWHAMPCWPAGSTSPRRCSRFPRSPGRGSPQCSAPPSPRSTASKTATQSRIGRATGSRWPTAAFPGQSGRPHPPALGSASAPGGQMATFRQRRRPASTSENRRSGRMLGGQGMGHARPDPALMRAYVAVGSAGSPAYRRPDAGCQTRRRDQLEAWCSRWSWPRPPGLC